MLNFILFSFNVDDNALKKYIQQSIFEAVGATSTLGHLNFAFNKALSEINISRLDKTKRYQLNNFIYEFCQVFQSAILLMFKNNQQEQSLKLLHALNDKYLNDDFFSQKTDRAVLGVAQTIKFDTVLGVCALFHNRMKDEQKASTDILSIMMRSLFALYVTTEELDEIDKELRVIPSSRVIKTVLQRVLPDSSYERRYNWGWHFVKPLSDNTEPELYWIPPTDQIEVLIQELVIYLLSNEAVDHDIEGIEDNLLDEK